MSKILFVLELNEPPNEAWQAGINHLYNSSNFEIDILAVTHDKKFLKDLYFPAIEVLAPSAKQNVLELSYQSLTKYDHDYVMYIDQTYQFDLNYIHALQALLLASPSIASARGKVLTQLASQQVVQENMAMLGKSPQHIYDLALNGYNRFDFKTPNFVFANYLSASLFRLAPIQSLIASGFEPLPLKYFVGADLCYLLQNLDFNHMYLPISSIQRQVARQHNVYLNKIAKHIRFADKVLLKDVYAKSTKDKCKTLLYKIRKVIQNPDFYRDLKISQKHLQDLAKNVSFRDQSINAQANINSFELDKHSLLLIEWSMKNFIIKGGAKLSGRVKITGSKNAVLPIISAALLYKGVTRICNVPEISDMFSICKILETIHVKSHYEKNCLVIDSSQISLESLDPKPFCKMRASILLVPALLAHFKQGEIGYPGGCVLGKRSIDTHLEVLQGFNVDYKLLPDSIQFQTQELQAFQGIFAEASVTASENAIMLAVCAKGKSILKNMACEPHVTDLCRFLNACGAKISGIGSSCLEIEGGLPLSPPSQYQVCGDYLQAGTYLIMGAITNSPIEVQGFNPEDLDLFCHILQKTGVSLRIQEDSITIVDATNLKAVEMVKTAIHPGFPTDLLAPLVVLFTQCEGRSTIFETLFEGRFSFLYELEKMGVQLSILNNHQAQIFGPSKLKGSVVASCDIRAGAAMVLAALIAEGESIVTDIKYIDRGYDKLNETIQSLGGIISRQEV